MSFLKSCLIFTLVTACIAGFGLENVELSEVVEEVRIEVQMPNQATASAYVSLSKPLLLESENSDEIYEIRFLGQVDGENLISVKQIKANEEIEETMEILDEEFLASKKMESVIMVRLVQKNGTDSLTKWADQCCRTCNGWKACGCKVESCGGCCCVKPCCPCP